MKFFMNSRFYLYNFFTLKKRIVLLFVVSCLTIFISTTAVSYYAISSLLDNRIQAGIQSNLKQIQLALQNTISNLNHASQQLAFQGSVGAKLQQFLSTGQAYEKSKLMDEIKEEMNLITFTNPGLGLAMYYSTNNNTYMFESITVKDHISMKLPMFAKYQGITYYGPHISQERFNNQYVISALRKVDLPDRDDIFVYIESGFKLTQNILESDRLGEKTLHLILDNYGRIVYSDQNTVFPTDTVFVNGEDKSKTTGFYRDFYWYKATSNQGWSVVSILPRKEYDKERNLWIGQMTVLFIAFLILSFLLSLALWKMVYVPLWKFNSEIKWIEEGKYNSRSTPTKVPEFDHLLNRFQQMKQQIMELFSEVERKEKEEQTWK